MEEERVKKGRDALLGAFSQLQKRVSGALASVNEILQDSELRRKTVELIQKQAGDTLASIQDGAGLIQQDARRGIRQALTVVQHRIQQERRKALLREYKNARVDVQIGSCLYEDAPQELRSLLWLALINDGRYRRHSTQGDANKFGPLSPVSGLNTVDTGVAVGYGDVVHIPEGGGPAGEGDLDRVQRSAVTPGPSGSSQPTASATPPSSRRPTSIPGKIKKLIKRRKQKEGAGEAEGDVYDEAVELADALEDIEMDPAEFEARRRAHEAASEMESLARRLNVDLKIDPEATRPSLDRMHTAGLEGGKVGADIEAMHAARQGLAAAHAFTNFGSDSEEEEDEDEEGGEGADGEEEEKEEATLGSWDMVSPLDGSVPLKAPNLGPQGEASAAVTPGALLGATEKPHHHHHHHHHALHGRCFEEEGEALARCLWQQMSKVEWPLPSDLPQSDAYLRLLEVTEGTEEIDDIIRRDIPRTFPEHPLFNFKKGQEALYHVLKAYSVHDPEVGYCQGMAFIAGLLLMYLPEEPAFQLFNALLRKEGGAGMREFFLPGLESLQTHMARLDWLQSKHLPLVHRHLQEYGIVPVLYASQWFMTAFACPLPPSFACRVLDVMLTERSTAMLVRVALAILMELEPEVLELHDFEQIIEHLKVQPVSWDPETTRRVLNNAVGISLTESDLVKVDELLREEQQAVEREQERQDLEAAASGSTAPAHHGGVPTAGSTKEFAQMVFELDNAYDDDNTTGGGNRELSTSGAMGSGEQRTPGANGQH